MEQCPEQTTSLYAYAVFRQTGVGTFDLFDPDYQRQFCVPELTDTEWQDAKDDESGEKFMALISKKKCPSFTMESSAIIGRCLPNFGLIEVNPLNEFSSFLNSLIKDKPAGNVTDAEGNPIANSDGDITVEKVGKMINYLLDVLNARGFAERVWADLVTSKWMIMAGMGVGVAVAFLWIILMRFIASIMVWVSLLATLGLLGLAAAYSWVKYSAFRDGEVTVTAPGDGDSVTNTFDAYLQLKDTWLALFIISTIFLVVIALITLFLRKRLLLAIALINEASKVWKLNAVTHTSESPGCGQHPQQLVLPPGLVPAAGGGDGLVRADRHLPRLLRDAAAQLGQQE